MTPGDGARLSRRGLLGGAAVGAVAVSTAAVVGRDGGRSAAADTWPGDTASGRSPGGLSSGAAAGVAAAVPFRGDHQAGIVTPAQDRLHFASFDVTTDDRRELVKLLTAWTAAAERMVAGRPAGERGAVDGPYDAPPDDTGEALDLPPAGLTITFGFGRSLFVDPTRGDRFGLADRMPAALVDLPHFPGDRLDPARTGGDLCVQACADDPQVAVHAIRNLARIGFGTTSVRWSQLGFGRTSSTTTAQQTPRNLFGFKDGTRNLKAEDGDRLRQHVWVDAKDDIAASWMAGGSYLVSRRINMHIETWDRTSLREQEAVIGRTKGTGAPLSGGEEMSTIDLEAAGNDGPLVPANSHVRLAHPDENDGVEMLRRGYNFTDGSNGLGRLDAGLFFLAYVRDPRTHYVPMQTKLARDDGLSEYLVHTGSGLWAIPPGVARGERMVGEALFV